jgi:hypothetical protein
MSGAALLAEAHSSAVVKSDEKDTMLAKNDNQKRDVRCRADDSYGLELWDSQTAQPALIYTITHFFLSYLCFGAEAIVHFITQCGVSTAKCGEFGMHATSRTSR